MYNEIEYYSQDVYNVKTRKIILYSNVIASSSNVIWTLGNVYASDKTKIKDLDIGGLIVTINHLITDTEFIRQVKEEFVFGEFKKMIQGKNLNLNEVKLWE